MRLNASTSRLFAGLLGLVAVVTGETSDDEEISTTALSKTLINFLPHVFNDSAQIFIQTDGDKTITWRTMPKGWKVTEINLYKKLAEGDIAIGTSYGVSDSNGRTADPNDRSSNGDSSDSGANKSGPVRRGDILQDAEGDVPITILNTHEAILPLKSQAATFGSDVWNNRLLYLEFGVQDETEAIKSYSPVFIIVNEPTQKILDDAGKIIEDQEPGPAKPDSDPIPLDGSSPTTSPDSDQSTSPSATSSLEPAGNRTLGGSGSGSGDSSKLSKGAIAGIVVGAVVGVGAIAGALVWFFCLRRRRRRGGARGLGGGDGSRAAVMMPEKEAAALSSESRDRPSLTHDQASRGLDSLDHPGGDRAAPYSPYADHHQAVPASPTDGGVAPGMALTTDSQGDLPLAPVHRRQHSGAGAGGAGTPTPPPPITARYAHLVEEGMTEEEIRRLEEEERQLDAAIEEAGNRHAPPR